MRVLIAAGGTGGHIFPGVAVAHELKRRDPGSEILFVGTPRGLESRIVPSEGFRLEMIQIGALKGVSWPQRIRSLVRMPMSLISAARVVRAFHPDVAVGVGGYASGPVLLTASLQGKPVVLIEPNAEPGFTNRLLRPFVDAAAVSFQDTVKFFGSKAVVTGNPVRVGFKRSRKPEMPSEIHFLIFGGSQGAHAINKAMVEALSLLQSRKGRIAITHQTGEKDYEWVKSGYAEAGFREADVRPFIQDMAARFEAADVLICRAGATTAAEVAAAGKAAIFVPFPFATDDHQRKNAEAFQRAGAGLIILQRDLTGISLARCIESLIADPRRIARMEEASAGLGRPDAAERAADLIEEVVARKHAV